ncbi:MAG: 4Fe-4S dicluster domain-containing protein [Pseudonocardiaceae bacterium]|nr:4Fe-4S dicluster domain-containing protein [Pseudonocardiaceae bacterium]
MRYGFAIDQRTCIGCHACTVACKTEHEIPVGQFRTWVKYVDKGTFPSTTREFSVMRCNHCTDAPCTKICPTNALFTREDGIVDFDRDSCIGCKSCMQACPYDAIYIDAESNTAAKCNFCAHRVDSGMEPACVVVCPTHSIWVGDLDDPESGISKLINSEPTAVRAPEQGTGPNVFYLGADRATLDPLAAPADESYIYADPDPQRAATAGELPGDPSTGARTTLNTAHPRPWGWRVTTYLWTKGVGAGAMALAALARFVGIDLGALGTIAAPVLGLLGTLTTAVLLIWDLKRPERFLYILTRPNPRSWLFLGALALAAFAGVCALWLGAELLRITGALDAADAAVTMDVLAWPVIPAAAMAAGYTAFLFGQAQGRNLWQSPLLFWHLLVQAMMVGAGALLALGGASSDGATRQLLGTTLVLATAVHVLMLLLEYRGRHSGANAATAAHMVTHGRYARTFWLGSVGLAGFAALLALPGIAALLLISGVLVQIALLAYESVFVRAGQDVPLS